MKLSKSSPKGEMMAKTNEIIALLEKCLNTQLAKEDTGNMAAYMDMVATRHELVHQALTKLRAEPKEKPKEKLFCKVCDVLLTPQSKATIIVAEELKQKLKKQPQPCSTCGGTKKKMITYMYGMMHKEIPCPDCQKGEITDG